jgi:hypothetical protein
VKLVARFMARWIKTTADREISFLPQLEIISATAGYRREEAEMAINRETSSSSAAPATRSAKHSNVLKLFAACARRRRSRELVITTPASTRWRPSTSTDPR